MLEVWSVGKLRGQWSTRSRGSGRGIAAPHPWAARSLSVRPPHLHTVDQGSLSAALGGWRCPVSLPQFSPPLHVRCWSEVVWGSEPLTKGGWLTASPLCSQGTNQQIKAHEASSAVQHVNLLKEWSNSLEKKVRPAVPGLCWLLTISSCCVKKKAFFLFSNGFWIKETAWSVKKVNSSQAILSL